jgi:hypothetical protein
MANTDNVRAGITGDVRVAPSGTTAPATPTATYAAGWKALGYISEDGVTFSNDSDTTEFNAWQDGAVVRRYISASSTTFSFTCLEFNYDVLRLFFPGSTMATADGVTTVTVKNPTSVQQAFSIDVIDGYLADGTTPRVMRWIVPKGQLTERGDITFRNGEPVGFEMTVTAYPDSTQTTMLLLSNDPAIAVPA